MCIDTSKQYTATMLTDVGPITIKLLAAQNPVTVNNFVFLAGYHFYDGTAFHRVVTGFVDQGGDPTGTGTGDPGYSFNGGAPKSATVYTAGALAMANSGSSSSDGSQFFIVVGKGGAELQPLLQLLRAGDERHERRQQDQRRREPVGGRAPRRLSTRSSRSRSAFPEASRLRVAETSTG